MDSAELEKLSFPIGNFKKPERIDQEQINTWINDIKEFPLKLKTLTTSLSSEQKNWKYRPEGWALKQVVHHCADSHINSFIRFKLALTEDSPTIKPYFEDRWAELEDSLYDDLEPSILLLEGLHEKWVNLLTRLSSEALKRVFIHPEHGKKFTLAETIGTYSWHGKHHLAHIELALKARGDFN